MRENICNELEMYKKVHNDIYIGAGGRESLYDLEIPEQWNEKLVIFIHGYMGYKDWGCWNLVQSFFCSHGYGFLKYNISHNGGTIDNPIDFDDLEAFSKNTYTKEIQDFNSILNTLKAHFDVLPEIYLIGHSRGGGIALLQSKNEHVDKICSWAGICSIADRFPEDENLEKWKENTYRYGTNSRTKQQMPHHIEQYYDYIAHQDRLDIEQYCKENTKPVCIIHGTEDTSVSINEGRKLADLLNTPLHKIENAQHTFGSSQPWTQKYMPEALQKVCEITLKFFNDGR